MRLCTSKTSREYDDSPMEDDRDWRWYIDLECHRKPMGIELCLGCEMRQKPEEPWRVAYRHFSVSFRPFHWRFGFDMLHYNTEWWHFGFGPLNISWT